MNKFARLLPPLTIAIVMIGLVLALPTILKGGSGQGLPAERAAQYEALLQKVTRPEAYLIAPREDVVYETVSLQLGPGATRADIEAAVDEYYTQFHLYNNKVSRPNPVAQLGRQKAVEVAEMRGSTYVLTGTPEILTVMMNFDGVEVFDTNDPVALNGECMTDTLAFPPTFTFTVDGPSFNEVPQPDDNWTPWLDPADSYTGGFTEEYFELFMYSTTGYTDVMRPELPNPWDGGNGFDFSGVTFKNWYLENSRGVYDPQGDVVEVTIPEAVSYFGAGACDGFIQSDAYYGRPRYTVAISAAEQINQEFPNFDWTAWDKEDVFDYDNDGNFFEPDGYVDHFFLIEAGEAEGGIYAEFQIWPHSWDVLLGTPNGPVGNQLGGHQVSTDGPLGGVWVLNYTVSDEVGGLGVLVHEYGHDIGLPDNYALGGVGDANVGLWDQMSSGTFGGALSGMQPSHMTIWDKAEPYLGWNAPIEIDVATTTAVGEGNAIEYTIGQQSKPPAGTADGLRINLPNKTSQAFVQPYDAMMWWSDRGDDRQESIAQTFTPAAGEVVTIEAQLAYDIELDWDYLFWEFSTDGGSNWTALPVYSDTTEITVYTDPNGNNPNNDPVITGFSGGWLPATATITPAMHGGNEVIFRFRYFTDAAVQEEGVYLDNISIEGSLSGVILFDDAESGDTWTHMSEGLNQNHPWLIFDGTLTTEHYYLVEWRNSGEGTGLANASTPRGFAIAGFDIGLNRMYWINEIDETGNIAKVDPFFMHTPGMLVYYANGTYEDNTVDNYLFDDPSWGAKGRILLVDANPDPFFVNDVSGLRAISNRRSAFDGAFTLVDRPSFVLHSNIALSTTLTTTVPSAVAQANFRDRIGSAPGIIGNVFIDHDAGVVLPTRDNVPYWAYWDIFGDLGNPGLNAFGVNLEVVDQGANGTWGTMRFWVDDDSVFVDKVVAKQEGSTITYIVNLKDASGSRYEDSHHHLFDAVMVDSLPDDVALVPGSVVLTGTGAIYTSTTALAQLGDNVPNLEPTTASIVWVGQLGGNRLGEPDAQIQYAVTLNEPGCSTNEVDLFVAQQMISDTFRNGGTPFLWPEHSNYSDVQEVCTPFFHLPVVFRN